MYSVVLWKQSIITKYKSTWRCAKKVHLLRSEIFQINKISKESLKHPKTSYIYIGSKSKKAPRLSIGIFVTVSLQYSQIFERIFVRWRLLIKPDDIVTLYSPHNASKQPINSYTHCRINCEAWPKMKLSLKFEGSIYCQRYVSRWR